MLIDFFYTLRAAKLPVSVKEFLALLQALEAHVVAPDNPEACSLDDLYYLCRLTLIKDERHFDTFDQAFSWYFKGVERAVDWQQPIPQAWLQEQLTQHLTEEQKNNAPHLNWDELFETLKKRLEEQKERHAGGNKWIGTGGTSPFGHGGYNPQGIRIGGAGGQRQAVKVWEKRQYRDYDDQEALSTRTIKIALKRLRRFARQGLDEELDIEGTIRQTAANAGYLNLKMQPERQNKVKVLLLMDVGGSMDDHVAKVQELFSAARSELKHLEFFYFHNCVYDYVWRNNQRRYAEKTPTWDLIHKYNQDYHLIFVGDATMSPYEILQAGGSVEYNNPEPGATWITRLTQSFEKYLWINPEPESLWTYRQSIGIIHQLMNQRMVPLTLKGLEQGMKWLSK